MKKYDDWKQQVPKKTNLFECPECGAEVDNEYEYCSDDCFNASQL